MEYDITESGGVFATGVGLSRAQEQLCAADHPWTRRKSGNFFRGGAQRHDQAFFEAGGGYGRSAVLRRRAVRDLLRAGRCTLFVSIPCTPTVDPLFWALHGPPQKINY